MLWWEGKYNNVETELHTKQIFGANGLFASKWRGKIIKRMRLSIKQEKRVRKEHKYKLRREKSERIFNFTNLPSALMVMI